MQRDDYCKRKKQRDVGEKEKEKRSVRKVRIVCYFDIIHTVIHVWLFMDVYYFFILELMSL